MQTLSFNPGRAFLASDSSVAPWSVVFEDEGVAAYFYACDRSLMTTPPTRQYTTSEQTILDAMLIYNVAALAASDAQLARPTAERIAAIEWSRDGLQAVLYLDGMAQALFDFNARLGCCRMDFPNFLAEGNDTWRKHTHAWSDAALHHFEAALYT
jgi:hypothetical protein